MTAAKPPVTWTTRQVADAMHVHPATVREWIRSGKLRAIRPYGRWLVPDEVVVELLLTGEREP